MQKKLVFGSVTLAVVLIAAVALAVSLNHGSASTSLNPSETPYIPQILKLQIRVEYSGNWSGTYADSPVTAPVGMDIDGTGDKTITIDRPIDCLTQWVVTAQAQKLSVNNDKLTISILQMDGTVLETASTSNSMPAIITAVVH